MYPLDSYPFHNNDRYGMHYWRKTCLLYTSDILEVDNTAVRLEQIENLKRLKEGRNQAEVDLSLIHILSNGVTVMELTPAKAALIASV